MVKVEAEIFIAAPSQAVFDYITDWRNTPRYERFITHIEGVKGQGASGRQRLAHSHFKLFGVESKVLYRYWSDPPRRYGGAQVGGLLRTGFWFTLAEEAGGTRVVHGEFMTSRWKPLERLAATLFWKVLFPDDISLQLTKLKKQFEGVRDSRAPAASKSRWARLAGQSLLD
jgi:hypothetical protein